MNKKAQQAIKEVLEKEILKHINSNNNFDRIFDQHTHIFACACISRRIKNKKMMTYAACIGFSIVVIFKSFLEVKIPGGAIYELFPNAMRSFFILNF